MRRERLIQEGAETDGERRAGIQHNLSGFKFGPGGLLLRQVAYPCEHGDRRSQRNAELIHADLVGLGAMVQAGIGVGGFFFVAGRRFVIMSGGVCVRRTSVRRNAGIRGNNSLREKHQPQHQPGEPLDFALREFHQRSLLVQERLRAHGQKP